MSQGSGPQLDLAANVLLPALVLLAAELAALAELLRRHGPAHGT